MSRSRSLTSLIADIRQRTNQENSTFVTDSEITEYLNQELAELHARLTQGEGQPHIRSSANIAVTQGTALYSLSLVAADFWRLQEVTATINGITGTLHPFMQQEHGWLQNTGPWGPYSPVSYRLQGTNIEFLPSTQSFTATIYYTPYCPRLVNGSDVFDGFNGYEMAAIYGTCAVIAAKEESDPAFHLSQKERIFRHIDSLASQRDAGHPERVQDVTEGAGWPAGPSWWI
jgi:hypothetical protein